MDGGPEPGAGAEPAAGDRDATPPAIGGGTRAGDRERDQAAGLVQEAHVDGRLDAEEMHDRLDRVYAARTREELVRLTDDLLPAGHGGDSTTLRLGSEGWGSTVTRKGRWRVPPHIVVATRNSDAKLDFTTAAIRVPAIHVEIDTKWGNVVLVVPQGWTIDMDDVTTKDGTLRNKAVDPDPSSVQVRVTGYTKHGTVVVRHPRRLPAWWPSGTRPA